MANSEDPKTVFEGAAPPEPVKDFSLDLLELAKQFVYLGGLEKTNADLERQVARLINYKQKFKDLLATSLEDPTHAGLKAFRKVHMDEIHLKEIKLDGREHLLNVRERDLEDRGIISAELEALKKQLGVPKDMSPVRIIKHLMQRKGVPL